MPRQAHRSGSPTRPLPRASPQAPRGETQRPATLQHAQLDVNLTKRVSETADLLFQLRLPASRTTPRTVLQSSDAALPTTRPRHLAIEPPETTKRLARLQRDAQLRVEQTPTPNQKLSRKNLTQDTQPPTAPPRDQTARHPSQTGQPRALPVLAQEDLPTCLRSSDRAGSPHGSR